MYDATLGLIPYLDPLDVVRKAADWIKSKVRGFRNLEGTLSMAMHQAAQLEGRARAAGLDAQAADAKALREQATALFLDYDGVATRLDVLLSRVPGLGVIPLAILIASGASIVALAAAMAAIFRRSTAQEKALDLVAAGVLTPEEAQQFEYERRGTLFGGIGGTAGIGGLVGLTIAMAVGLPLLADLLRPKR